MKQVFLNTAATSSNNCLNESWSVNQHTDRSQATGNTTLTDTYTDTFLTWVLATTGWHEYQS